MQSFWDDSEAKHFTTALQLRVYTSRLLGKSPELVLHGGGNTSVKDTVTNLFGETEEVLYVKGSGWDLATIEKEGFAPVKMDVLLKMAELEALSDTDMVTNQRAAMTDPNAPNPSIEAILHAIIPYKFVDHTHADSVVAITNTEGGEEKIKELYGERVLIIPYVMPGFILAVEIYKQIKGKDLSNIDALILMNHGVFTFDDDAKKSYEKMIRVVTEAEEYIAKNASTPKAGELSGDVDLLKLAQIRAEVSTLKGSPMVALLDRSDFAALPNVESIATRGPLTPDHVIRTKRDACIIAEPADVKAYGEAYRAYFERNNDGTLTCLDPAPRWGVWKGVGTLAFGSNAKESGIIADIKRHTMAAIRTAEAFGGYKALSEDEIFKMEYWELEQAKLKKGGSKPEFTGKIALVCGFGGLAEASLHALGSKGAAVIMLQSGESIQAAVARAVRTYGGLDIIIDTTDIPQHDAVLDAALPYLRLGIDPSVVFVESDDAATGTVTAAAQKHADTVRINLLKADGGEVASGIIAEMAAAMAGRLFSHTAGAVIPIQ